MPGAEDNLDNPDKKGKKKKTGKEAEGEADEDLEDTETEETEGEEGEESEETGELSADDAKKLIKKLRAENAKHRTKNKELAGQVTEHGKILSGLKKQLGGEDDNESPEDKVKRLQAEKEALSLDNNLKQLAIEHEIPKEKQKFFRFLLAEKFEALEEGEELSDEDLESIIEEVKTSSGKKSNSTGLNGGNGGRKPSNNDELTAEIFAKMNHGEKSALYVKNQALYNTLFQAAKEKRLLR